MPRRQRYYSILSPPSLSMSELVKTTLDHDSTDMLIDKWLEHRNFGHDAYHEWFRDVRERKHAHSQKQTVAWNKGDFLPENVFCRTVDTGRLIPLDRTWTTHVYHHHSMQERKLSMLPVVFTMVCDSLIAPYISPNLKLSLFSYLNSCSCAACTILVAMKYILSSQTSKNRRWMTSRNTSRWSALIVLDGAVSRA